MDTLKCAHCGKSADGKGKLKKNPYCSTSCVKAAKAAAPPSNGTPVAQQNGIHNAKIKTEITDSPPSTVSTSPSTSTKLTRSTPLTNGTSNGNNANGTTNGGAATSPKTAIATSASVVLTNGTGTANNNNNSNINGDANMMEQDEPTSHLVKWTVDEVCDYIRSLSGYSDYAEDFSLHEIDGQALVLLNENHLVQTMGIKLGPALKIMSKIEAIKNSGPPIDH